jgi:hypothetical protein
MTVPRVKSVTAVAIATHFAFGCGTENSVVISEFMASNGATLQDDDSEHSDWIELHNRGRNAVNLDGWFLTDHPDVPRRYRLPAVEIEPGAYLVVFASGKNRVAVDAELHTNFRLKSLADFVALVRWDGSVRTEFRYPDQLPDVSYGRANGEDTFFARPTPGGPNAEPLAR